jgi:hypothetical protein
MPPSPLGPFVGPTHVRQAVLATLADWAPFYIAEANRQTGVDLPGFVDFVNEPIGSPETVVGDSPRYIVAVPGTLEAPQRRGDGSYWATWDVQLALWMWGADYQDTQDRLGHYVVAIRQALTQHASLGRFAKSTTWRGERYAEVSATAFRTWGQAVVMFGVQVAGVLDSYAGPATVPDDPTRPPVPDPAVRTTTIRIE